MIRGEMGDGMSGRDWHRLREARLQAHYAAQWLGRIGGAFIPPQPDYSHTSMNWIGSLNAFSTNALKGETRFALIIPDPSFLFLDMGAERTSLFSLNGRTDKDVRQWLGGELAASGMQVEKLDRVAPYEIPTHAIGKGGAYSVFGIGDQLSELAVWFSEANSALEKIQQAMIARSLSVSSVRCWPHHLDLATLISLDKEGGENARSVNVGLSPGDEHYDEPYYYVSPYPYPGAAALPPLPKLGHWHTRDFTAAIAPASRIIEAKNKKAEIDNFLQAAIDGAIKILS
jgi:hypothetical protein